MVYFPLPMPLIQEYRCKQDNKLLFKGLLVEGQIEIKCRSCHEINTFEPSALSTLVCRQTDCPNRVE